MALTPEDVVNKRFQPTKFREGYDQDEVDDFLDEVVVELRRLNQENEELRQRLVASESRITELQRSASEAPQAQQAPAQVFPTPAAAPAPADPYAEQQAAAAAAAATAAAAAAAVPPAAPAVDPNSDPNNTNNLLQLARRLHEEHVREGVEKRDALIAEGQAAAARVVQEAEAGAQGKLQQLDQERQQLEARVEELRTFERDYRQKLKGYIEGQLRELDDSPVLTGGGTPAPAPAFAAAPAAAPEQTPAPAANYTGFAGAN
ncbi:DivIVA domain-containing protein [Glaciihabitans arcticus]|uniref:Cell wall synthesis protein Wag31 n=1 Tax=Glaciihabitans arcticus TaxID=2668039 RepID=A0A4Q9GTT5_9MICO|nr:DivIVA domain-containing protein [Glaciihabitans arcticus]TBN56557.1 DivIVA domain-containing protein [Glaciihabitans arcticus]